MDRVNGATIYDTGEGMTYTLVYPSEAKYDEGKMSVLAPVGAAMLGNRVGDTIGREVPSGMEENFPCLAPLMERHRSDRVSYSASSF